MTAVRNKDKNKKKTEFYFQLKLLLVCDYSRMCNE